MQGIIIKVLVALIALVVIFKFLQPLLISLYPPFGLIVLILGYFMVLAYLLGAF